MRSPDEQSRDVKYSPCPEMLAVCALKPKGADLLYRLWHIRWLSFIYIYIKFVSLTRRVFIMNNVI